MKKEPTKKGYSTWLYNKYGDAAAYIEGDYGYENSKTGNIEAHIFGIATERNRRLGNDECDLSAAPRCSTGTHAGLRRFPSRLSGLLTRLRLNDLSWCRGAGISGTEWVHNKIKHEKSCVTSGLIAA